jgi:hypothetical protein
MLLYIVNQTLEYNCSLCSGFFFQVVIPQLVDLLEAEGLALLLGVKLAATLNLQEINLLIDNKVLANTAKASSMLY